MRTLGVILGVLLLTGAACQAGGQEGGQIPVSGTLSGSGDQPMRRARVVLEKSSGKVSVRAAADSDGRFSFTLNEPGGYGLKAKGRRHDTIVIPLIVTTAQSVQLDIRLTASKSGDDRIPEVTSYPTIVGEIATVYLDVEAREKRIGKLIGAAQEEQSGAGHVLENVEFLEQLDRERAPILERISSEQDPLLRHWLLLRYFDELLPLERDQHLAIEALQIIPPTSPLWSFEAWWVYGAKNLIFTVSQVAKDQELASAYVRQVVESHPDPEVRNQFLGHGINAAHKEGDEKTKWRYYNQLQAEHRGTNEAKRTRKRFAPQRKLQVGNPIPRFSFVSLDNSAVSFTNRSLLGTVYLIDFWGTWCGPCIAEIPVMQDAYHKYHEAGFQILSVAIKDDRDAIKRFREERYAMAWMHTRVSRARNSAVEAAFEITGVPRPILVDEEGRIIAIDGELLDGKLPAVLAEVFGQNP